MSIVVVEGCDRVGKTTLCRRLEEEFRRRGHATRRLKASRPEPGVRALDEYAAPLLGYDQAAAWIVDRWHVGELVYGPLYRGKSRLSSAQRVHVEQMLSARGAVKVHVTADAGTVRERMERDGEAFLKAVDAERVLREFEHYTSDGPHGWLRVRGDDSMGRTVGMLVDLAASRAAMAAPVAAISPSYAGSLQPDAVLVGDAPNHRGNERNPPYAAFTPWDGNSAEHLLLSLDAAGVDHAAYGYVNANGAGENLLDLVRVLNQPRLVTLGCNAELAVERAGLADLVAARLRHPQYEKRFKHHELSRYAEQLRDAIENEGTEETISGSVPVR